MRQKTKEQKKKGKEEGNQASTEEKMKNIRRISIMMWI
jgi:hypothetical protein